LKKKKKRYSFPKPIDFQFERGFSIGGIAAESDPLLNSCFLFTEDYESIIDMKNHKFALIGRSGTGKTAIFKKIKSDFDHYIEINPETLAFQFLGTSNMVNTLRKKSISLDFFYKLLWRHVFVVEILKHYFPDESKRMTLISQLIEHIQRPLKKDKEKERAIGYLDQWGGSLLQAPQERIKNIHDTLEKRIFSKIGVKGSWGEILGGNVEINGEISKKTDVEEKIRIIKEEINKIQIQDLNAARDYLSKLVLDDEQQPCFVLVDDLDRFLTGDSLYFELIRALILEAYDWKKIPNIKVVYALRDNIIHKVEAEFTSKSYQREKFEDHRIHLHWSKPELIQIVDKRLKKITENKKLTNTPTMKLILPTKSSKKPDGVEYILSRTLDRPRDVIDFINRAGNMSIGKKRIPLAVLHRVEESYSQGRLDALLDEWRDNCNGLEILLQLLKNGPQRFELLWWSEKDIVEVITDPRIGDEGWCAKLSKEFNDMYKTDPKTAVTICRKKILQILYEVGLVGVRISAEYPLKFCYTDSPILHYYELEQIQNPQVIVHPIFQKALDIQEI
jgi:Cdc6-like AAA superfamily ATPase